MTTGNKTSTVEPSKKTVGIEAESIEISGEAAQEIMAFIILEGWDKSHQSGAYE